jgi:ribosomal protein S18 acetylase RimI-like enzyme
MSDGDVTLRRVDGDRAMFVPRLLEADESESVVRTYLEDGELFEILAGDKPVGVVLLTFPARDEVEIKNIAVGREDRGRGIGRAAIESIRACARARGADRLLVGTADASLGTIAFYRACGFNDAGRITGFFDRYPDPVVEDGRRAHDMVRFVMAV